MTINITCEENRYLCVKLKRIAIGSDAQDTDLKGLNLNSCSTGYFRYKAWFLTGLMK